MINSTGAPLSSLCSLLSSLVTRCTSISHSRSLIHNHDQVGCIDSDKRDSSGFEKDT